MKTDKKPQDEKDVKKPEYPRNKADIELEEMIKAKYNIIYVVSWEERRVIDSLEKICDLESVNYEGVQVWDAVNGLATSKGIEISGGKDLVNPEEILKHISKKAYENKDRARAARTNRGPIFVLCDLFNYLDETQVTPVLERALKNLATELKRTSMHVVIVSPTLILPLSLEKVVSVIDYPLPDSECLSVTVNGAKNKIIARGRVAQQDADTVNNEEIVKALLGLTIREAEDAIAKAIVSKNNFDIPTMLDLKRQIIRKSEVLDYIHVNQGMRDVGGLEGIKHWVRQRKKTMTDMGREYGLAAAKGLFMLGPWGVGKSLCAKAVAQELQLPLLKMEMGRLYGKYVGESEGNLRRALKLAEAIPCVLFIDELEKSTSSAKGDGDTGTSRRVVGALLDWMQEKTAPVFIVAAANSMATLDPALLRRGRFDEMFFVDLPDSAERTEIFEIHISKPRGPSGRRRTPADYRLKELVAATDGFSGAEIASVVDDGLVFAYDDNGREMTTEDMLNAIKICKPMSKIAPDEMDRLREEASARMRSARTIPRGYSDDSNEDNFDVLDDLK